MIIIRTVSLRLLLVLGCTLWLAANTLPPWAAARPVKPPVAKSKVSASRQPKSQLLVQGKLKAIARPPRPGASPYKEAIITLHLTSVKAIQGKLPKKEILVFVWGMRDNKWTRAASYRPGQSIKLSLQPWEKLENKYGGFNRIELEGDALYDLDLYWGEIR